jgi:DNA-binding transcriptional LysR family regulator
LQGLNRNIQAIVPSLFAALSIVEKTDLAVILPERVATVNARRFQLSYRPLPIEGGEFKIHAVRHIRDTNSSIHAWLIEQLHRQVVKIANG